MAEFTAHYKVIPLPVVQKWARKELSTSQLRAGIKLVCQLRFYPQVPDLSLEPCDAQELTCPGVSRQLSQEFPCSEFSTFYDFLLLSFTFWRSRA